jgi:outer membrane receptor protein involved in Fe transport
VPDFTAANFSNSGFSNLAEVFGLPNQTLNGQAIDDSWRQSSNNWALFTHNIFDITDQFSLTVGARYTHEKKTLRADLNDTNNLCTFFAASPLAALQALPCVSPSIPGGISRSRTARAKASCPGTVVLSFKPTDECADLSQLLARL